MERMEEVKNVEDLDTGLCREARQTEMGGVRKSTLITLAFAFKISEKQVIHMFYEREYEHLT